jgi:hypothetical protein
MGRVVAQQQCPSGGVCATNYQFNYGYDKAGGMAQYNNGLPSGGGTTSPAISWGVTLNGADQVQALSVLTQPWGTTSSPDPAHPFTLL